MANNKFGNVRQTHVSPGIYTKETELIYASKSLGITTLGLAGETVKGPAFQPIMVENWREYQQYFGGTNPEKFRGSQYPKYELPYIAQSYLKQSNQLQVVRVLGLSGVNAGPAWVIKAVNSDSTQGADHDYDETVVAVIRSRGEHLKSAIVQEKDENNGICNDVYEYDPLLYYAKAVWLEPSKTLELDDECIPNFDTKNGNFNIDQNNYGRFTICVLNYLNEVKRYSVSLNPGEKNYIYNVIGGDPERGETEVYVEELYDVALKQLIEMDKVDQIKGAVNFYPVVYNIPDFAPVNDLLTVDESMLKRRDVGKRFLYGSMSVDHKDNPINVHTYNKDTKTYSVKTGGDDCIGHIYTVTPCTESDGTRHYYYVEIENRTVDGKEEVNVEALTADRELYNVNLPNYGTGVNNAGKDTEDPMKNNVFTNLVKVIADGNYYVLENNDGKKDVIPVMFDMNNYKEEYRYASTPWVVSELKGSAENVELTKLFRFHTISDGNSSSSEVKISIENIDPENGTFDVLVRDFYDTDAAKTVLERYKGVNLRPGDRNYIAIRIGSFDEQYENVSSYITVEVNETDATAVSIPCGFMGYPVRNYDRAIDYDIANVYYNNDVLDVQDKMSEGIQFNNTFEANNVDPSPKIPYFRYNTEVDDDIRIAKQYFGISDLVGIDTDILKYKGVESYNFYPDGMTPGFHLDSRILSGEMDTDGKVTSTQGTNEIEQTVTVDGMTGFRWITVGKNNTTDYGIEPRIGNEDDMIGTIYEDKKYRKFTMAFYGGFDGWDYYRKSRSNSDDFKWNKYRGKIDETSGEGANFSVIRNPEAYGFNDGDRVITSDWYAYMSAIRQFANPKDIDINVLATPGIDYVNNNTLVGETIDMIEEERADSIYVVTTPDKPYGAGDSVGEMYNAEAAALNLEDSEIDSNYTCTYYPWVKYYDAENSVYIYLPHTRDVVRYFAFTDNTKYPWFAAAGWNRGDLETTAVRPKKTLKLEEQDTLYDGRINFVNSFANEGMKIWGDKNMQEHESQMNRISKRRLLLHIRKLCAIAAIGLIFDPNDNTTKQSFESAVTPVLDNVMSNRGITDWRLEIDDSQEARDRLELPAVIYIKPQPNLEYITINFVITPSGVSFDDI